MDKGTLKSVGSEEALRVLRRDGGLSDAHVVGRLYLPELETPKLYGPVRAPLKLTRCLFDDYFSPGVMYKAPISWDKCIFTHADISSGVYFLRGLICRDSEFQSEVLFDAGGHNQADAPIVFERVTFHGFVDFFDCLFSGPLVLNDVRFLRGTNLMHEKNGWVSFEVPPTITGVEGRLDVARNIPPQNVADVRSADAK